MLNHPLLKLAMHLYRRIRQHEIMALGAQMTYYLILSFFPFLIFLITVLSYTPLANEEIISALISVMPREAGVMINQILMDTWNASNQTLLSFGMIATLWAASRGIKAVIRGINKAHGIQEKRPFLITQGISILYLLIFVLVIILTFGLIIFGKYIGSLIFDWLDIAYQFDYIWAFVQYVIPISIIILVFAFLYKTAPNESVAWIEVVPGALFSTFGWLITSYLFSLYVAHLGNFSKTYGSLGGIIILLLWLYISSIILLLGGEINAAVKHWRNDRIISMSKWKKE